MFWYLFLDPHLPPTHHSNYSLGVQIPIVVLGLGVLLPSTPPPHGYVLGNQTRGECDELWPMVGENRQLFTEEPVAFEK